MDGFQYTFGFLSFFAIAEGYVNVTHCSSCTTGVQNKYNYVYQYKDHLGNIRLSYSYDQGKQELKIMEENHYYPFGLKHTNYNVGEKKYEMSEEFPGIPEIKDVSYGASVLNKYKYNGKEYQDELGLNMYDYGARNYDPAAASSFNMLSQAGVNFSGGSGGKIFWDPSGSPLHTTAGLTTNSMTDLAHEMFHGLDSNRGLLDTRLDNGVTRREWQPRWYGLVVVMFQS